MTHNKDHKRIYLQYVIWAASFLAPLLLLKTSQRAFDQIAFERQHDALEKYSLISPIIAVLIAIGAIMRGKISLGTLFQRDPLIPAFSALFALSAIFASYYAGVVQAAFFLFYYLAGVALWCETTETRRQVFRGWLLVAALFMGGALAIYGLPKDRWIGGIHPNTFGQVVILASCLALFLPQRTRAITLILCVVAALMVQSRYALVCSAVAAIYALPFKAISARSLLVASSAVVGIAAVGLGFAALKGVSLFEFLGNAVFMLDDPLRGVGSGMSGRASRHYAYFVPQLETHPLLGFGFRNKDAYISPHNGYASLILEVGLPIAVAFIAFFIGRVLISARSAQISSQPEAKFLAAALLSICISSLFQPQLLNFRDLFSLMLFVSLAGAKWYGLRERGR